MASKLGLGLLAGYDPNDLNAALNGKINGVLLLEEHQDRLSTVITNTKYPALRIFHPGLNAAKWMEHAKRKANLEAMAQLAVDLGKHLWVQGPNEVEITEEYGRREAERTLLLHGIGARAIVMNAGVGRTTEENVAEFRKGFDEVLAGQEVEYAIGVHEYGYIWPFAWMGQFQGNDINPERDESFTPKLPPVPKPGEEAFLIGRFQHVGLPENVPVMITETGLDRVTSEKWDLPKRKSGEPFGGWRTCAPYWKQFYPNVGWAKMYGQLLQWTDAYYSQFPQVKALYVFGLGPHHDDQFQDYDIGATMALFMMLASDPPPEPPDPPDPPTTDPPEPPEPPTPPPPPDKLAWVEKPIVWGAFFNLIQVIVKAAGRNPESVLAGIRAALTF